MYLYTERYLSPTTRSRTFFCDYKGACFFFRIFLACFIVVGTKIRKGLRQDHSGQILKLKSGCTAIRKDITCYRYGVFVFMAALAYWLVNCVCRGYPDSRAPKIKTNSGLTPFGAGPRITMKENNDCAIFKRLRIVAWTPSSRSTIMLPAPVSHESSRWCRSDTNVILNIAKLTSSGRGHNLCLSSSICPALGWRSNEFY